LLSKTQFTQGFSTRTCTEQTPDPTPICAFCPG
jgi:hypothetical protein